MCNISETCMCETLDFFIRENKSIGLRMRDFFHKNDADETYNFLKSAMSVDAKHGLGSVVGAYTKLAASFLLQEVETNKGQFVYQFRNDGFCPNEDVRRRFTHFVTKLNGKKKNGTLDFEDIGELKERLQDVVEQVQHRVFPILMTDKSFAQAIEKIKTISDPTTYHKDALKIFKDKQTKDIVDDLMGEMNIKSRKEDIGENPKTGVSISH